MEEKGEHVKNKDGSTRVDTTGRPIPKDCPRRKEFHYHHDGSMAHDDPDLEGECNIYGETRGQVYGYDDDDDWANPCGSYASYGSFGATYT